MSLRRSSRTSSATVAASNEPAIVTTVVRPNDKSAAPKASINGRKRPAKQIAGDTKDSTDMPPPATPVRKRQRQSTAGSAPPPLTPTPSAIGVMIGGRTSRTTHSTGETNGHNPSLNIRPAEPHHTNATLVTPRGTQVTADIDGIDTSPSRPQARPTQTSATLLQDALDHLIKVEPKLKPVIEQHPCHVFSPEGLAEAVEPFRALVSAITSQQVSGAAANSIKNKFIALYPTEQCPNGFPTPDIVAATKIERLRTAGLSQRKAEYIQGLAEKFASGELTVQMLVNGSDEEVMEKLVAVRGLGAWSVEMFMCFALKRMDIFSTGDLGVQRGMAALAGKDVAKLKAKGGGKWKYMSEADMLAISEKFRPYRSVYMWYSWRVEDVDVSAIEQN